jgi:leader peptidase (prepilin peptidase)/N-methyltransferase
VVVPDWIWFVFLFAFGCCVGSFLNVVIYRLPRDKSIVSPPSACPACGKRINFYDNIPLVSWLLLGAKCRYCKAPISPRYFIIELFIGFLFVGLFILYFSTGLREGLGTFLGGGWLIYLVSIVLLSAFTAASAIDLELWIIPLSICWFVTIVGFVGSAVGGYIIDQSLICAYRLLPSASAKVGSLAVGALIGLILSLFLLITGLIKRSYEAEDGGQKTEDKGLPACGGAEEGGEHEFNHRSEACKEIVFLLPIVVCSIVVFWVFKESSIINNWWSDFSRHPVVAGFLGSVWGYFIGCGVVWITRIIGNLSLGKEAMGLGDVHLMGAAGAVIGPIFVVFAFFIAPFFGLTWAVIQMFFRKTRQIPYGPFLSLAVFTVMILHDFILDYWGFMIYR